MSRLDKINRILRSLQTGSPESEGCALISGDGLLIGSALPQHLDQARVGGMSATLLSLGQRAARELERGDVEEVLVRGKHGYAVMISAGPEMVLLMLTSEKAMLGLVFLDIRRAAKELADVI